MNKYKIALIGAGQLGSRHLQGLANSTLDFSIEIVEPSIETQEVAKKRFDEISNSKELKFFQKLDDLSDKLDLVIVATNSNIRATIVKELLNEKKIANLILEKVLFQRLADYQEIEKLLHQKDVKTWVNHPRRCYPFYKKIKQIFKDSSSIHMNISGGGWGLACNGLHYLDLLSFLTEEKDLILYSHLLDSEIIDSKRKEFKEVTGLLCGKLGTNKFSTHCDKNYSPVRINLSSEKVTIDINELLGNYTIARLDENWRWEQKTEKIIYYQSELTNQVVESILINKDCYLPTYLESQNLHKPFIELMLKHINKNLDTSSDVCPIT